MEGAEQGCKAELEGQKRLGKRGMVGGGVGRGVGGSAWWEASMRGEASERREASERTGGGQGAAGGQRASSLRDSSRGDRKRPATARPGLAGREETSILAARRAPLPTARAEGPKGRSSEIAGRAARPVAAKAVGPPFASRYSGRERAHKFPTHASERVNVFVLVLLCDHLI